MGIGPRFVKTGFADVVCRQAERGAGVTDARNGSVGLLRNREQLGSQHNSPRAFHGLAIGLCEVRRLRVPLAPREKELFTKDLRRTQVNSFGGFDLFKSQCVAFQIEPTQVGTGEPSLPVGPGAHVHSGCGGFGDLLCCDIADRSLIEFVADGKHCDPLRVGGYEQLPAAKFDRIKNIAFHGLFRDLFQLGSVRRASENSELCGLRAFVFHHHQQAAHSDHRCFNGSGSVPQPGNIHATQRPLFERVNNFFFAGDHDVVTVGRNRGWCDDFLAEVGDGGNATGALSHGIEFVVGGGEKNLAFVNERRFGGSALKRQSPHQAPIGKFEQHEFVVIGIKRQDRGFRPEQRSERMGC